MKDMVTPPPLLHSSYALRPLKKSSNTIDTAAESIPSTSAGVQYSYTHPGRNSRNTPIASFHNSMTMSASSKFIIIENGDDGNYEREFDNWHQSDFDLSVTDKNELEGVESSIYSYSTLPAEPSSPISRDDCNNDKVMFHDADWKVREPMMSPHSCCPSTSSTTISSSSSLVSTLSSPASVFTAATDNDAGWRTVTAAASSTNDEAYESEYDDDMYLHYHSALASTDVSMQMASSSFADVGSPFGDDTSLPPPPTTNDAAQRMVTPTALYAGRKRYRPSAPTPDHPKNSHVTKRMMLDVDIRSDDDDSALMRISEPCLDAVEHVSKLHGVNTVVPCFFRPIPI